MKTIQPEALQANVFDLIGNRWMLVTAGNSEMANTMTASWGSMGVLWNLPCAFIFIRPQRYTKTFIDDASHVSLSFLMRHGASSSPIWARYPEGMSLRSTKPGCMSSTMRTRPASRKRT